MLGIRFHVTGGLEMIFVVIVEFGLMLEVWLSSIGMAPIFNPEIGGSSRHNQPQIAQGGERGFGDDAFDC